VREKALASIFEVKDGTLIGLALNIRKSPDGT